MVGRAEETKKIRHYRCQASSNLPDCLAISGCHKRLMGQLQWHHGDGDAGSKNNVCSLRIHVEIEFSGRCCVSDPNCPTHQDYLLNLLLNVRGFLDCHGNIGQGTGWYQSNFPRILQYGLNDKINGVHLLCLKAGQRKLGTSKP